MASRVTSWSPVVKGGTTKHLQSLLCPLPCPSITGQEEPRASGQEVLTPPLSHCCRVRYQVHNAASPPDCTLTDIQGSNLSLEFRAQGLVPLPVPGKGLMIPLRTDEARQGQCSRPWHLCPCQREVTISHGLCAACHLWSPGPTGMAMPGADVNHWALWHTLNEPGLRVTQLLTPPILFPACCKTTCAFINMHRHKPATPAQCLGPSHPARGRWEGTGAARWPGVGVPGGVSPSC